MQYGSMFYIISMCFQGTRKRGTGRSQKHEDDDDLDLELAFTSQASFNLEAKLNSDKFKEYFVVDMLGKGNDDHFKINN